ncbi:MAG: redoxin domain-containing protein [Acidobacteriaceae bacterium]|nr:redoxin domain-containing protein [Acidobacteriaceae bacterium]MBV9779186.1 redoxin domain-containing protein [Acidobacteriaceae bacterium]
MKLWTKAILCGTISIAALLSAQEFKVGSQVTDFRINQLDGTAVQFSAIKSSSVTVLMFISVQCPVSNSYNERMNALYRDYSPKGVKFIAINANSAESPSAVLEHARAHNFSFPVYKDQNNSVADEFGATVTPETYVIDSTATIRYHGSIDDSMKESRVTTQRLRLALDAVLAGKEPSQTETKAFGCSIKRVSKSS